MSSCCQRGLEEICGFFLFTGKLMDEIWRKHFIISYCNNKSSVSRCVMSVLG